jgi:hypothetical protein
LYVSRQAQRDLRKDLQRKEKRISKLWYSIFASSISKGSDGNGVAQLTKRRKPNQ